MGIICYPTRFIQIKYKKSGYYELFNKKQNKYYQYNLGVM